MKRLKLKAYVIPSLLLVLAVLLLLNSVSKTPIEENYTYVSNSILEEAIPVMNEKIMIINPYLDQGVTIGKEYYDYKGESSHQEKSIVYYDGTYMQNSGVDFISNNVFEVVSILPGTVTEVKEDDLLGKIVEVKHDKYVALYQSLSEVSVKKGDTIFQGQPIGKSGTNELDKSIGNHLHFELSYDGNIVNPLDHLNKELKD